MKAMLLILTLLFSFFAQAQNEYKCSNWVRENNMGCVQAGRTTDLWNRVCDEACQPGQLYYGCPFERICTNEDPNNLKSECTDWVRENGISCYNKLTKSWEQKWVRSCQVNIRSEACSNQKP